MAHIKNAEITTANSNVEVETDNVIHVDFGAMASANQSVARLAA